MPTELEDILGISKISIDGPREVSRTSAPVLQHTSALERLPWEIREQIYQNLLVSDHVKEPSPDLEAATYSFQPAILATNRSISQEALQFRDQNVFVVVVARLKDFCGCLKREGVPVISSGLNAVCFLGSQMSVQIEFLDIEEGPFQAVLMVAQDLPKLCRFIRIQNLALFYSNSVMVILDLRVIESRHKLTLKNQKLLLEPFKKAHVGTVQVNVIGPVNAAYRNEVVETMKRDMNDISATKWSDYKLCKEIKQEGDFAFRLGKWERAKERYKLHSAVFKCFRQLPYPPYHVNEWVEWRKVMDGLTFRTVFNQLLLNIRCDSFELDTVALGIKILQTGIPHNDRFSKSDEARMNHYIALTFAELGQVEKATRALVEALRLSPEDKVIQESLAMVTSHQAQHGISKRVLGDSIMEEGKGSVAETEFEIWQNMFKTIWALLGY